ncbi:hypothetical protein NA57DRAFT_71604 [Rhizodiscina lignyota]|uniref:Uncharacterized protein n=1 Tax=Rhizodiscina lignyota TaxID=1504668 RepID=A0A9P4IQW9_9PEZI|nr:hypothetical protein NA57DRAFT_71604 [Rhizodiscina lignyota]
MELERIFYKVDGMSGLEKSQTVLGHPGHLSRSVSVVETFQIESRSSSVQHDLFKLKKELATQYTQLRNHMNVEINLREFLDPGRREPHTSELQLKELLGYRYDSFIDSVESICNNLIDVIVAASKITRLTRSDAFTRAGRKYGISTDPGPEPFSTIRKIIWQMTERQKMLEKMETLKCSTNDICYILLSRTIKRYAERASPRNLPSFIQGHETVPRQWSSDVETMSLSTLATEVCGGTLAFLSVSLCRASNGLFDVHKDALLDTGATDCCIAEELARKLGLTVEEAKPDDRRALWTATPNQTILVRGITKLKFCWKNKSGESEMAKVQVYVVPELFTPIILSHDWTMNHLGVWEVAQSVGPDAERIAVLGLSKLGKKARAAQQSFQQDRTEANQAHDRVTASVERAELEKKLGIASVASTTDSSTTGAASTTTSQSTTTQSS